MNISTWLNDVYYDSYGTYLWSKQPEDGGSQMIGEVRGWGRLQNCFDTEEEAAEFQDYVGKFIAEAINEKIKAMKDSGILDLKVGDKVHYVKGEKCDNGIVKEIPTPFVGHVRVVYYCAGDWNNYMDYTSALTNITMLRTGWKTE